MSGSSDMVLQLCSITARFTTPVDAFPCVPNMVEGVVDLGDGLLFLR